MKAALLLLVLVAGAFAFNFDGIAKTVTQLPSDGYIYPYVVAGALFYSDTATQNATVATCDDAECTAFTLRRVGYHPRGGNYGMRALSGVSLSATDAVFVQVQGSTPVLTRINNGVASSRVLNGVYNSEYRNIAVLTGSNGFPVIIAAADSSEFDANWLYITYCADATCTTSSETKIPGPPSHNQFSSPGSVAAGWLADGTLFVAHQGSTDACTTNDFIGLWVMHCLNANCSSYTRHNIDTGLASQCSSTLSSPVSMVMMANGLPLMSYEKGFEIYFAACNSMECNTPVIRADSSRIPRGMFRDHTGKPFTIALDSTCTSGDGGAVAVSSCYTVRICNDDCSQVAAYGGLKLSSQDDIGAGVMSGKTVVYGIDDSRTIKFFDITNMAACTPPNCPEDSGAAGLIASLYVILAATIILAL